MDFLDFMKDVGKKILGKGDDNKKIEELVATELGDQVRDLNVKYENGEVKISGEANSQAAKEKAFLLAGNIFGVGKVIDAGFRAPQEEEVEFYTIVKGDTLSKIAKKYYDIYLPDLTATQNYFGYIWFDVRLLEDTEKKSLDYPKLLAKICYDNHLADIATTQNNLAYVYRELGRLNDAEQMHLKSLKIRKKLFEQYIKRESPSLALTMIDLGDLYVLSFRYDDAEPLYLDALKIAKNLAIESPKMYLIPVANLQNKIGNFYVNTKDYEEAEPMYLESLEIYKELAKRYPKIYLPHVAIVQNNLGNLYLLSNDLEKAERFLDDALNADPNNDDVLYSQACLESLKNNKTKAIEFLKKAIELNEKLIEWAVLDEKFDNIRDLEEFKELTAAENWAEIDVWLQSDIDHFTAEYNQGKPFTPNDFCEDN